MTEQQNIPAQESATVQGVQQANISALEKTDPMEAGIQQPVKIEGVADKNHNPYNERVDPAKSITPEPIVPIAPEPITPIAAPTAAPIQQIAPISANGDKTSARESMKSDAPAEIVQASQPDTAVVPSVPEAEPPAVSGPISEPIAEKTFEEMAPMEQAENLLQQIPGRFRLY